MVTEAESQRLSFFLKFWWHQLTYMTVEPVEGISAGAGRVLRLSVGCDTAAVGNPKQLRENLDCNCCSHTSHGRCGGTKMKQLPFLSSSAASQPAFYSCWGTGPAGTANYHNFKEQCYM